MGSGPQEGVVAELQKLQKRLVEQERRHADISSQLAVERRSALAQAARAAQQERLIEGLRTEIATARATAQSAQVAASDMQAQRDLLAVQLGGTPLAMRRGGR